VRRGLVSLAMAPYRCCPRRPLRSFSAITQGVPRDPPSYVTRPKGIKGQVLHSHFGPVSYHTGLDRYVLHRSGLCYRIPLGTFLYVPNRGHNCITGFSVDDSSGG